MTLMAKRLMKPFYLVEPKRKSDTVWAEEERQAVRFAYGFLGAGLVAIAACAIGRLLGL